MQHYGHKMMYSVKPGKVYYVFEISRLLGPASISRNPGMSTIPKDALTKNQQKSASGPHRKKSFGTRRVRAFSTKHVDHEMGVQETLVSNSNLLVLF
jgi:hypothetical protein